MNAGKMPIETFIKYYWSIKYGITFQSSATWTERHDITIISITPVLMPKCSGRITSLLHPFSHGIGYVKRVFDFHNERFELSLLGPSRCWRMPNNDRKGLCRISISSALAMEIRYCSLALSHQVGLWLSLWKISTRATPMLKKCQEMIENAFWYFFKKINTHPADTWRNNNVTITSKRRYDVVLT